MEAILATTAPSSVNEVFTGELNASNVVNSKMASFSMLIVYVVEFFSFLKFCTTSRTGAVSICSKC